MIQVDQIRKIKRAFKAGVEYEDHTLNGNIGSDALELYSLLGSIEINLLNHNYIQANKDKKACLWLIGDRTSYGSVHLTQIFLDVGMELQELELPITEVERTLDEMYKAAVVALRSSPVASNLELALLELALIKLASSIDNYQTVCRTGALCVDQLDALQRDLNVAQAIYDDLDEASFPDLYGEVGRTIESKLRAVDKGYWLIKNFFDIQKEKGHA